MMIVTQDIGDSTVTANIHRNSIREAVLLIRAIFV